MPPPLQDTLSSSTPDQDPTPPSPPLHDPILSPILPNPPPSLYPLGSLTFTHVGPLTMKAMNSISTICSSPNEEIPPFSPRKRYPTLVQMLKKWHYQGQGLGPQEQGIMELIIVKAHP